MKHSLPFKRDVELYQRPKKEHKGLISIFSDARTGSSTPWLFSSQESKA